MTWCLPQRFPPWTILNALCHAEPPGSTIAGDFTGTQPGHGCPTEPTFPGCSRKIHQQFSWSSASPQSRAMAAAITQSWGWRSPNLVGLVLSHPVLTFGSCSEHRSQHKAAHIEIQLQALEPPCWAFLDSTCNSAMCWSHTKPQCPTVQFYLCYFQCF